MLIPAPRNQFLIPVVHIVAYVEPAFIHRSGIARRHPGRRGPAPADPEVTRKALGEYGASFTDAPSTCAFPGGIGRRWPW
ncbi:hypothetical protein ACFV23_07010 [Streptomyces sp. NPDC059627]